MVGYGEGWISISHIKSYLQFGIILEIKMKKIKGVVSS
jgi:hypothetical protein